jgi:two-component system sensor histidine kinase UhpB
LNPAARRLRAAFGALGLHLSLRSRPTMRQWTTLRTEIRTHPRYQYVDSVGEADFSATAVLEALRQSQIDVEAEKSALARALHDDLGGLLVGAIMDIGWIAQQAGASEVTKHKLARAIGSLRSAIDIERTLIENARPSLLDDVGLFATIRWHLKASCDAAGVVYSESYPAAEMGFSPEFKICVFRLIQRSLKQLLADGVRKLTIL